MIKFVLIFASNIKRKPCMSIHTCRGYRPSSALQAVISVYHGTFNVCLQNSVSTCSIVLYQNVSCKIHVVVTFT